MIFNVDHYLFLFQWIVAQVSAVQTFNPDDSSAYSFRVFNAVHSAFRLWDSALNHNGMGCYMATIPQDIRLYHGSNTDAIAEGMAWYAFDIQHALMFTKSPATESFATFNKTRDFLSTSQTSLNGQIYGPQEIEHGWQHEYATSRALKVLYFDGLSAAKTTMGTLDMQEILLNRPKGDVRISDSARAQKLCDLLRKEWKAEVDGFIRVEHGIEVVLCQTQENLVPVRITKRRVPSSRWKSMFSTASGLTEYFRTAFARDVGFGRSKAIIDFDSMVTGLPYIQNLSASSRLFDSSPQKIEEVRVQAKDMVQVNTATNINARTPQDWQATTDLIISHYSDMLQRLATIKTSGSFSEELEAILSPFLEEHHGFPIVNITTCASQYFSTSYPRSAVAEAIFAVSTAICKTLAHVEGLKSDLIASQAILLDLISRLDWNTWKKCVECAPYQFCWTPVWPLGTVADRMKPSCRSEVTVDFEDRYWI